MIRLLIQLLMPLTSLLTMLLHLPPMPTLLLPQKMRRPIPPMPRRPLMPPTMLRLLMIRPRTISMRPRTLPINLQKKLQMPRTMKALPRRTLPRMRLARRPTMPKPPRRMTSRM